MTICVTPAALGGRVLLQGLVLSDPVLPDEPGLCLHARGGVRRAPEGAGLEFAAGAQLSADSYMNLFNLGTWSRHCRIRGLALRLSGQGRFGLTLARLAATGSAPGRPIAEIRQEVTLTPEGIEIGLDALLDPASQTPPETSETVSDKASGDIQPDPQAAPVPPCDGVIVLSLAAREDGARLCGGGWLTRCPDPAPLRLAIVITTFRREADLARAAARITGFLDAAGPVLGAQVKLVVIDNGASNGESVRLPPHPRLEVVANRNLGGAGGFARGLARAQDGGFTHALFMDDDAAAPSEAILRTIAFLRLARSPRAALAGAMISAARPWAMWENGAVFFRACRPIAVGTDLRDPAAVLAMELAASGPKPAHFYGGFWFFAFPVAAARHFPFPFFVRGDDISFSLANRFDTATLNGVVSVQEDFAAKESPLTLYLDLRNHLHHHLVHPELELGARGSAKVALWFLGRSLVRMHYDSAEAQLAAWEDVLKGPGFFAENADMAARRPEIAALAQSEAWRDLEPGARAPDPVPPGRLFALAMKFTLNGHLIPFRRHFGRQVTVPVSHRGLIWPLWGATRAGFRDAEGRRGYEVAMSPRRFWRILARALVLTGRWIAAYPALRAAHRAGYEDLTARGFWERQFAAGDAGPAPSPLPPPAA